VTSPETYRPLKDWLGRVVTRAAATGDAAVLRDAADALLQLTLMRYQRVVRRPHDAEFAQLAAEMTPFVAPLVVAADAALFPNGAETSEVKRMFDPGSGPVALMQQRIRESMGVAVPGITIRPVAVATPGRFTILLNESPIAVGTAGSERDDRWERCTSMLSQLESVLMRNLDAFLGIQDVVWLLADWEANGTGGEGRRELRLRAVPDDGSLARLTGVLQALVREGVPVTDLTAILRTFELVDASPDLLHRVELVRAELAGMLPGADASRRLIRVPEELERVIAGWTQRRGGKRFLALPGEAAESLRLDLGRRLAAGDGVPALVVSEAWLRPSVRRLVALEHPEVPVLSLSELPDSVLAAADWSGSL